MLPLKPSITGVILCLALKTTLYAGGPETLPPGARGLLEQAGSTANETERLTALRKLQQLPDLAPDLRRQLETLLREIERWNNDPNLSYFGGKVWRKKDYPFGIPEDSPFYALTCLYRGRMLVWLTLESGYILNNPELKRVFLDKAVKFFRIVKKAFPQNPIARMYLGEPIPWRLKLPGTKGAPKWAALMREDLERLRVIVLWWIRNRMREDGQYGGGWGDDCEMWRWWVSVLIAFQDPEIVAAQRRFSEALLNQPHMKKGYTSRMSDVEHTAEDSADTITPMVFLRPDDPLWRRRALRLAELMEKRWTGINKRGFLQFKSSYFTADRVDLNPRRACDTVYHPRAVQPALLLWQRTGDRRLGRLFSRWLTTWVDAAQRSERGKPPGILPSAIHWPDGKVGGLEPPWWDPRNHSEATLYTWPSAMPMMLNSLLLAFHMTGKDSFLKPLCSMAAYRLAYLRTAKKKPARPGSADWCASQMDFVAQTAAKYRVLTGDGRFDELLERQGLPIPGKPSPKDEERIVSRLLRNAQALRVNFPGYTTEVRYTDRVLRFPALFAPGMLFEKGVPGIHRPNPQFLYSLATGDPGDIGYFPLQAVRWLTPPKDIACRVLRRSPTHFEAELYHFGTRARPMRAELYLLEKGIYEVNLTTASGEKLRTGTPLRVTGPRTQTSFALPPRTLCRLIVTRKSGL